MNHSPDDKPAGGSARPVLRISGAASRPASRQAGAPAAGRKAGAGKAGPGRATERFDPGLHQSPRNVWRGDQNPRALDSNKAGPGRATERSDPGMHQSPRNVWRGDQNPRAPDASGPAAAAACPDKVKQPATVAQGAETHAGTRLNKRMADLRLCSRREADDWIARGWVFVNGEPGVTGQRVQEQDAIHVDKLAYTLQEQQVTFLLHKPVGYVSGQPEDGHASAASLLGSRSHWRGDKSPMRFLPRQLRGLAPAGRLDIDSTGLLVLTQDGRIARQLIGADSAIDKEYLVRVEYAAPHGVVREQVQATFPAEKLALLRHGLSLDGQALRPALVDWQNPEQLRFVLTEGKKRQIRRMCEAVGLRVTGLKRVRIGKVTLGDLPSGQWRFLRVDECF